MEKCSKEKEIERLSKAVYGNGKKGLVELTSNLYERIETIDPIMKEIQSNVQVLLQFQTQIKTKSKEEEKHENEIRRLREGEIINKRWRIGLTISTVLGMLTIIISLLVMINNWNNNGNKRSEADNGVTEEEFRDMWYKYRKDHLERNGNLIDVDTISYLTYINSNY